MTKIAFPKSSPATTEIISAPVYKYTGRSSDPQNLSGIRPTEFKVLILPDEVSDKIGAVYIPDEHKDRSQFAQQKGRLVALAPLAFSYDKWDGAEDQKPKPGDRVLFAKFAGFEYEGKDGKKYRVVNDKDVSAIFD